MDEMQRFKETYIAECFELLEDMEEKLLGLDENSPDMEELNAIFRCAHSIKGGSGAFGFNQIKNFTHILEELLDKMRDGKILPTREVIDTLLASVDIVKQMVVAGQKGEAVSDDFGSDVARHLKRISSDDSSITNLNKNEQKQVEEQNNDEISVFDIDFKPKPGMFLTGNEPLLIIRELKNLGVLTSGPDISNVPDIYKIDAETCYIIWNFTLETEYNIDRIKEVFEFVEGDCELKITKIAGFAKPRTNKNEPKQTISKEVDTIKTINVTENSKKENQEVENKSSAAVTSIRVDVYKVDRLVNMVGEIVITQAMIAAQAGRLHLDDYPELMQGLATLSQHTLELQEAVMSVRMQPVKSIFSRMPRIVRDLSRQLGKDIRLEMEGENTELDKTVIEQLNDPLVHMIRNSVDHGIDKPESRIARGKLAQGLITLSAEHTGGKILIKISDDGLGINRPKVLAKAKEKGLVAQDANLTDSEIDNLIFMPGFSTADVVSDVSGRGVGMDVVKRNIEGLGGSVNVISKTGEGSTFIVTLPLTLAILDGMIVEVGKEKYIIPIGNILETLKPRTEEIRKIAYANDLVNVRGEFIQLVYLCKVFGIKNAVEDASKALVVLVENGHDKFGLVVDELIGQQQVVIKSLEENSQAVQGISAATILGDGKVSLILDVSSLQNLSLEIEKIKEESVA